MFMNSRSPLGTGPTARPRTSGRATGGARQIQERLVTAADALLRERQAEAITSRDIARAASLSDGVLYNYFPDKHELLVTALLRRFEQLLHEFDSDLPRPGDGAIVGGLADLVRRVYELQVAVLPMLANLVSDPPLLHRFMTRMHQPPLGGRRFLRPVADYLATEQRLGRLGSFDPEAAADLLVGAVLMQSLIDVLGTRDDADRAHHLEGIVRTLLTGLAPRPERSDE
jgi:AcrR family transcriptional regulator